VKHLESGVQGLTKWLSKGGIDNLVKVNDIIINDNGLQVEVKLVNNLTIYINTMSIDDSECNVYFQYESDGKVYDLSYDDDWGFLSEMPNEVQELKDVILSFLNGSLQDYFDKLEFINREPNKGKIIERLSYELVMKGGK
jgi:hypothetical protein